MSSKSDYHLFCWELTEEDVAEIVRNKKIWVTLHNGQHKIQPHGLFARRPYNFPDDDIVERLDREAYLMRNNVHKFESASDGICIHCGFKENENKMHNSQQNISQKKDTNG